MERNEPKIRWIGAGVAEKRCSGEERGAGGCGAGTEREAGVAEKHLSAERFWFAAHIPLTCSDPK